MTRRKSASSLPAASRCPSTRLSPIGKDVIGFNEIFLNLTTLKLGVYTPVSYILPSRLSRYEDLYDTEVSSGGGKLKQIDREKSLRSLMTVNLLKRLESSVASFRITLKKLQQIHLSTLSRIENFRKTGQDGTFADVSATFEDASPDEDLEFFDPEDVPSDQQTGGKVNIQLGDMDLPSWEHDLRADLGLIETLLGEMEKVSPADDAKLQHLKEQILAKIEAPINPGNRRCSSSPLSRTPPITCTNIFRRCFENGTACTPLAWSVRTGPSPPSLAGRTFKSC